MKTTNQFRKLEKAQVLPFVVVAMIVLVAFAALIIDGGSIMLNRRTAQAAADAGAMAGARELCYPTGADPLDVARSYAFMNDAATANAQLDNGLVSVNTSVTNDSFFAKIFNVNSLDAVAEAAAGCYAPSGKSVIPMTWRCWPNIPGEEGPFNEEYGCKMQTLSWDNIGPMVDPNWFPSEDQVDSVLISDYQGYNELEYTMSGTSIVKDGSDPPIPPEQIYIIFDSNKLCIEDGGDDIYCDLPPADGKKDIQLGGDRGLLYLTADTSDIKKWITDEGAHPDFEIKSHIWLSGKSGVDVAVVIAMATEGFPGEVVLIPIYNVLCENNPETDPDCVDNAHKCPPWPLFNGTDDFSEIRNQSPYYHILAFAPFYISCVSKSGDCPGYRYAQDINNSELKYNEPVIEGYFLSDVTLPPDGSQNCDINLGNCVVSLSK